MFLDSLKHSLELNVIQLLGKSFISLFRLKIIPHFNIETF